MMQYIKLFNSIKTTGLMKTKIKILYFIFNWMIFFSLFNIYGFSMTNPKGGGGLSYSGRLGINMLGNLRAPPTKKNMFQVILLVLVDHLQVNVAVKILILRAN